MKTKILLLSLFIILLASCNKDDEDSSKSSIPITSRAQSVSFQLNGQSHDLTEIEVEYEASLEYLDITASSGNNLLQFESAPVPSEGTYTTSISIGIAVSVNDQYWFCNTGCTVVVNEHDRDARWIDISVSGQMTDLLSTTNATLNTATIKSFY